MKRIIPFLILAVAFILGCQPKEADPEQRLQDSLREDSLTLKIGYLPTLDALPLLVAEREGYFDTAKVRLRAYEAAMDLDTALQNNRVQLITTDLCRSILLNKQNPDIKVIGKSQNTYHLITAQKQRIRKIKDMEERIVAIARNEISDCLLDKMLEKEGLSPDIVNRPQINSLQLRKQMMNYEELDAALVPEPYAMQLILAGDRSVMTNEDLDEELGCFTVNKQAYTEFLEQMNVVARAYNKAVAYLQENKPDLTAYYSLPREVADTLTLPHYDVLSMPREKDVESSLKWLQSRTLLTKKHKTDNLLEERFLNR